MFEYHRSAPTPSPEGVVVMWRILSARAVRVLALALLGAVAVSLGPLEAQRLQDRPNAIEAERAIAQLRSPYCPGFMLEVCTSYQAAALRDSLYMLAAEGMAADELIEWMIGNHGEEWRAVPPRSGAGLWAWIVPPLALLAGLGALLGWIRASRAPERDPNAPPSPTVSAEDRERLVAAMREMEESGEEVV
jgi:cytochrome c-type biogenesis protein CcmH/NrfF